MNLFAALKKPQKYLKCELFSEASDGKENFIFAYFMSILGGYFCDNFITQ